MRLSGILIFFLLIMMHAESARSQDASGYIDKVSKTNKTIKCGEYHLISKIKFIEDKDTTISSDFDVVFQYLPTLTLASINDGKTITIYDSSDYKKTLDLKDSTLRTSLRNSPETDAKIFDYTRPYFMADLPRGYFGWEVESRNDSSVILVNRRNTDSTIVIETYTRLYLNKKRWFVYRFEEYFKMITPLHDTVTQYTNQYIYNVSLYPKYRKELENRFRYESYFKPKSIIQSSGHSPSTINDTIVDSLRFIHLKTLDGTIIYLDSVKASVTILDFYYLACYPCMLAMPILDKISKKYNETDLKIIGINSLDKSVERIQKLIDKNRISYPHCIDNDGLTRKLNITAFPTLIILDRNKAAIKAITGYSDSLETDLDAIIAKEKLKN